MTDTEILQRFKVLTRKVAKLEKQSIKKTWIDTAEVFQKYKWSAKTLQRMRASGEIQKDEWRKIKFGKGLEYDTFALDRILNSKN